MRKVWLVVGAAVFGSLVVAVLSLSVRGKEARAATDPILVGPAT